VLDGTQNFEVDRQTADALLKIVPSVRTTARLNRWFLQLAASKWAEEGQSRVLDLGSALPTQGYFNEYMPEARILFSDIDALSVEYGQEILKDQPNMRYVQGDVREPGPLLDAAAQFFGSERRIAIGFIGICYFMSDEEIRRLMRELHAFCAPGSVLAASYFLFQPMADDSPTAELLRNYRQMVKATIYLRTPKQMAELLAPWRVVAEDSLENWLSIQDPLSEKDHETNQMRGNGLFAEY